MGRAIASITRISRRFRELIFTSNPRAAASASFEARLADVTACSVRLKWNPYKLRGIAARTKRPLHAARQSLPPEQAL